MITSPPDWRFRVDDAGDLVLSPVDGEPLAIRYRERQRPLVNVVALVRLLCRQISERILSIGDPEPLTTDEGEEAVCVVVDTEEGRRALGWVLLDDFYAEAAGHATRREGYDRVTRTVRQLIEGDHHFLGIRRRRYRYCPPPGWRPVSTAGFLTAGFVPPDYPENPSELVVGPAVPARDAADTSLVSGGSGGVRAVVCRSMPVRSRKGPTGRAYVLEMRHPERPSWARVAAVLEDDRYAYPLVVDSLPDRGVWAREALLGVVASIEPIPRPRAERFFSTPMGHWAE